MCSINIVNPIIIRILPPIIVEILSNLLRKFEDIELEVNVIKKVTRNITNAGRRIDTPIMERENPTAKASMLVAMEIRIKKRGLPLKRFIFISPSFIPS